MKFNDERTMLINFQPNTYEMTEDEKRRLQPKTHLGWSVINALCSIVSFYRYLINNITI